MAAPRLPTPDDRPRGDVVLYDGECRLCRGIVRGLHAVDVFGRLSYLPARDPRVGRRYPDLPLDELLEHVYVIEPGGERHRGADAVRFLSRRLPPLWGLVPILHLPGSRPLWTRLYGWVSHRRHALTEERR